MPARERQIAYRLLEASMKIDSIALLNHRLQYISLGSGKTHARQIGPSRDNPGVDWDHATFCGRAIPDGTQSQSEREIDVTRICGRCKATLGTFARIA
jgi:hypothetical protein